jgi:uncharacterized coiled-coil protein SlyX
MIGLIRQLMNEQAFRREVVNTHKEQISRIRGIENIVSMQMSEIRKLQEDQAELIQQSNENVKHLRLLYSKVHDHDPKTKEITGNEVEGSEY